jgi:hypothetical protein
MITEYMVPLIHVFPGISTKIISPQLVPQRIISTNTEVAVLRIKKTTRLIPKALVMRHLLRGTTINILDNVKNKETVETRRVGEMDTRYSSWDVMFMYNPATPTPRRISSVRKLKREYT